MQLGKYLPLLALTTAIPGHAFQFTTEGPIQSSLDLTLTYGTTYRLGDQEAALIADPNLDDANRNFDSGIASNGLRGIADFEWRYNAQSGNSYGLFTRGVAWYDDKVYDATNDNDSPYTTNSGPLYNGSLKRHDTFTDATQDRSGADAEVLDLFLFAEIAPNSDHPASLRLGRQVINWGESAFIQNGLSSVINSADVSKASLPGTEVKEILRPLGALFGSVALTDNVTVSAYYQYEWEEIISPPYGTFLSPVPDPLSGEGSENFLLPVGAVAGELPFPQDPQYYELPFIAVDRIGDDEPSNSGQWGASLNWFIPALNDTEFGFYVGNYHRKRPSIVFDNYSGEVDNDWLGQCVGNAGPAAGSCAVLSLASTAFDMASYRLQYQEDVEYMGFSWNSLLPWTQTAFSGEVIYHKDIPIQTTSLLGGLVPTVVNALPIGPTPGAMLETELSTREKMVVTQVTFNQDLNFMTFADSANLILELGHIHIIDLKDGESWMGNTPADSDSWGYRASFNLTWYDGLGKTFSALSGTDLIWNVNFAHDVDGVSPVVGTGFTEGAKAFSTGLEGTWQNTWSVKLDYTNFFGDGFDTMGNELGDHVLGDRDNISLAVKYRF
ncbi:MAG: DUF1302 family protein [Halioglobus sp.]